ncbi:MULTISPECIES: DUF2249 domain-containing protein [Haloarcula]|uniref:DUF2249 domain-containing protein n=1 Tax=Haloarcula TaxID=2237 RepID=UPI0023ECA3AB|nr:DUF2249 domain-containing protein [Halomicroarcula sp. XH51]
MPATTLDLRDLPPAQRHQEVHAAFEALDDGETLEIVNDHDPRPLYLEFRADVEAFDAENYECTEVQPHKYVAKLPKRG